MLLLNYISGKPLLDHWKEVNKDKVIKETGEMVANLHNTLQVLILHGAYWYIKLN